jgi:hypothetical protein
MAGRHRVAATWSGVEPGLLSISLNKIDCEYAKELEIAADGVASSDPIRPQEPCKTG